MFDEIIWFILQYMCYNMEHKPISLLYFGAIRRYRKSNTFAHPLCTYSDTFAHHQCANGDVNCDKQHAWGWYLAEKIIVLQGKDKFKL